MRIAALLFAAAAPLWAVTAQAGDKSLHGRVAVGSMSVDDSSPAGDFNSTRVYYRLIAEDVAGWEDVNVNIDGRARSSSPDYNDDIPSNRLLLLNLEVKKILNRINLTLGRSFIDEMVGRQVDGADIELRLYRRSGVGLFGGGRPDPFDDSVNFDYMTYGAYAFALSDRVGVTGGWALDTFKGEKDGERAHGNLYFIPSDQFHVWGSADADNIDDSSGKGWEVTNLTVHANWRPSPAFGMSFTFNDFRAVNRIAAMLEKDYEYSGDRYTTARVKTDYRFWRRLAVYGGFDQRSREIDSASASRYYVGLRNTDSFFHTRWDLRYSDLSYFGSSVTAMYGSLGVTILDRLSADFSVTLLKNSQDDMPNDMEQTVFEVDIDWSVTKNIYAAVSWSYSEEKYLDIDSVYSSQLDDNFTTTTLYAQAGYRF